MSKHPNYLGGQAVGQATVDVLFGDVNPSGRLAESFPKKLEDNPSYLFYFDKGNWVEYNTNATIGELVKHPLGKKFWEDNIGEFIFGLISNGMDGMEIMMTLPVTMLLGFIPKLSMRDLKSLFNIMNQK